MHGAHWLDRIYMYVYIIIVVDAHHVSQESGCSQLYKDSYLVRYLVELTPSALFRNHVLVQVFLGSGRRRDSRTIIAKSVS